MCVVLVEGMEQGAKGDVRGTRIKFTCGVESARWTALWLGLML